MERVVQWVMIGGAGAGLLVATAGMRLDLGILAGGLLFAAFTVALYILAFRRRLVPVLLALSMAIMAAFGTLEQAIKPVFLTSPAAEITGRLLKLDPAPSRLAAVDVRQSLSNLIRLLSGGRLIVQEFRHGVSPETLLQFPAILGSERTKDALAAASNDYVVEEYGTAYGPPKPAAIWEWIATGEKPPAAFTDRTAYYLIRRS